MDKIKQTLEQQMQILSERTNKWHNTPQELYLLTKAMCEVARQLQSLSCDAHTS